MRNLILRVKKLLRPAAPARIRTACPRRPRSCRLSPEALEARLPLGDAWLGPLLGAALWEPNPDHPYPSEVIRGERPSPLRIMDESAEARGLSPARGLPIPWSPGPQAQPRPSLREDGFGSPSQAEPTLLAGAANLLPNPAAALGGPEGSAGPDGPSFVWQNPWGVRLEREVFGDRVSARAAFGWSAMQHGQITDIGQAGDQGPASAAARADVRVETERPQREFGRAAVFFWRTFELAGSPEGWHVAFDGTLAGSVQVYQDCFDGEAVVRGAARIVEGSFEDYYEDPPGIVSHDLDFGEPGAFFPGVGREINEPRPSEQVVSDGTYTVMGTLRARSSAYMPFRDECWSYADFFQPPGLVVSVDAVPWDGTPPAPIVEYTFDEGTGTTARNSGTLQAGTNGRISGGATYSTDTPSGKGYALHFDGTSGFVSVPDTWNYVSRLTVEAWIKPDAVDGQRIIWDDYGSPGVLLAVWDGVAQFGISTTEHPGLGVSVFAGSIVPGKWQHVAGAYDGFQMRLYVNGELVGTQATSGNIIDNGNGVWAAVGRDNASPALHFAGKIDDFRLSNSAWY